MKLPEVIPALPLTLEGIKERLIHDFPCLGTEEGKTGLSKPCVLISARARNKAIYTVYRERIVFFFLTSFRFTPIHPPSSCALRGRRNRCQNGLSDCHHVTEIFGGAGMISLAFQELGLKSKVFDCRRSSEMNIHTPKGLYDAAVMLAHTETLAVFEPTCSSWGWVNLGSSLRGVEPRLRCNTKKQMRKTTIL